MKMQIQSIRIADIYVKNQFQKIIKTKPKSKPSNLPKEKYKGGLIDIII